MVGQWDVLQKSSFLAQFMADYQTNSLHRCMDKKISLEVLCSAWHHDDDDDDDDVKYFLWCKIAEYILQTVLDVMCVSDYICSVCLGFEVLLLSFI